MGTLPARFGFRFSKNCWVWSTMFHDDFFHFLEVRNVFPYWILVMTLILLVTKSIALKFTRLPMPQSKTRRTKNAGKALAVVHIFWSSKLDDTVHRRYPSPVDIRNISWFLNCIQTYSNIITDAGSYPSTIHRHIVDLCTNHSRSPRSKEGDHNSYSPHGFPLRWNRWINRVPWRCCRFLDVSVCLQDFRPGISILY